MSFSRVPIWDESVYVGMSKYLYSRGHSGMFETLRPLGLPLIIGPFWILGFSPFLSGRILSLIFSAGSIVLLYMISLKIISKKAALTAAIIYAVTPLFFLYSTFVITEISSTFIALLAVWFFINKRMAAAGFFGAVAMLFRFPQGLILISFLTYFLINALSRKKWHINAWKMLLAYGLTVLPYLLFNYVLYRTEVSVFWHAALRPFILGYDVIAKGSLWMYHQDYLYFFRIIFGQHMILALSIVGLLIFILVKGWRDDALKFIFVSSLIFLLYYSRLLHKEERYALVFIPFIIFFVAYAVAQIVSLSKIKWGWAFVVVLLLLIPAVRTDSAYYGWWGVEQQKVGAFYDSVSSYNLNNLLTVDPVIAVYSDASITPYFESPSEFLALSLNKYDGILYTPKSLPCSPDNNECLYDKERIIEYVGHTHKLAMNTTIGGFPEYFYIKS